MLWFRKFWFIFLTAAFLATPLHAQDPTPEWAAIAKQAETIVQRTDSSLFSLNNLRNELQSWRDKFAVEKDLNAGRIQTVDAQIAALGPEPESGEAQEISARRSALRDQRDQLFAPNALAHEAFAQAEGLLRETDARISARRSKTLMTRSATPLNPIHWSPALSAFGTGLKSVATDVAASINVAWNSQRVARLAPLTIVLALAGFLALLKGPAWAQQRTSIALSRNSQWLPFQRAGYSVVSLALAILGLCLIAWSLYRLNVMGAAAKAVVDAALAACLVLLFTQWLSARFFPKYEEQGPLQYDQETRATLRKMSFLLGVGIAIVLIVEEIFAVSDASVTSLGVLLFPLNVFLGVILFRFGSLLRTPPVTNASTATAGRTRRIVGLLCMGVAVATPVLTGLGYAAASDALFVPSILTLALLGVVLLLQRLVNVGWSLRVGQGENDRGPLAPVLIGASLFLLALPAFALIWGAQVNDLREWWTRFQTGFTFGKTTLSPTDFLTFVIIFVVGYLLTRFIQSALRGNVLPRTRLDKGGQNAIVAGVGYVGIILAAVIAITSAGIDLSNLAIVAGALSVGIGFGLQTIVSNFVSGIILLIERPVSEGDWIEVNGQMGYVKNISVRATQIETFDRTDVIIPNADLVSGQVTNWTRGNSVGRLIIPVGVAYGTDVEKVMEILKDIAMAHPMVLHNPKPSVLFQNFGASSLDFEIRAILRDVNFMLTVKSDVNTEIARRFAEEGIEIPFPQTDLWLRNAIPSEASE